jgi:ubiquinone/menaquinone biosynthesis C-methylase UbiE
LRFAVLKTKCGELQALRLCEKPFSRETTITRLKMNTLNIPKKKAPKRFFEDDTKHAAQAIRDAQFIAFAPYVFQASVILRDKGILAFVEETRAEGCTIQQVAEHTLIPYYGARVLMEAGLGIGLLYRNDDRYFLTKTGHVFINHPMARINTDFMRDVCRDGAADLESSIMEGKPNGLKHLGNWDTIYQGLSILPEPAKSSWFAFDHYYSDLAFPEVLPFVFKHAPKSILDIGANTGKWALACMEYDANVHIGLLDLPVQLEAAKESIDATGLGSRVTYHPINILDNATQLPVGYDLISMSQFLNCFTDTQIISILQKCHDVLQDDGRIIINEAFWDCQQYEAGAFSLQMASLYFTTMANGNSQIYDSKVYLKVIDETGFEVVSQSNNIGLSHTILELRKK